MAAPMPHGEPCTAGVGGRLEQRIRTVGIGVLALALSVAAVAVIVGQQAAPSADLSMPAPQSCPPPCVPHVFSSSEEAMLSADGKGKGKLTLPGSDSAVEEAMKAATDANGQMTQLAPGTSDRPISDGGSNPFRPTRTAAAVIGHGGIPFVSQWAQMHGEDEGDWARPASQGHGSGAAAEAAGGMQDTGLRASSGTLTGSNIDSSGAEVPSEDAQSEGGEGGDGSVEGAVAHAGSLSQALRSLSNRRLRAIVRLLLKSRAINKSGSSRGGVEELRAILNGSRKREEEKRRMEQEELLHIRRAMDELAYKASRRRRESHEYEDAIKALSKRLGEGGDDEGGADMLDREGDSGRQRDAARELRHGDQERQSRSGDGGSARLDGLFEDDDVGSRAEKLVQLLGGDEEGLSASAEHSRRNGPASEELAASSSRRAVSMTGATQELKSSNKAIVQELALLAARSPRRAR